MSSFNQALLLGNLGRDPEVRFTGSGRAVARFSMATTEKWTQDGEKKERTDWHQIVVWGPLGEACGRYLKKGSKALVEGSIQTRKYEKNGEDRYITEIVARRVQFLDSRTESAGERREEPPAAAAADDDIPF